MKVNVKKQPKATIEMKVTVENSDVKKVHDELFESLVKSVEIKGFRKGQAPADIVREKTDLNKFYGDVINALLQRYYPQALKEQHINPIANPKVDIQNFDIEKDFEFTAEIAVTPEVKVGDYMKELKSIKQRKENELRDLNAQKLKKGEKLDTDHVHTTVNDVVDALVSTSTVEMSDIVIEDEADRLMSRLVNQAQAIGLSLEQYLKTQNKTAEDLRNDYLKIAEKNLKAEFALAKLIDEMKVEVSDTEVEEMIKASGDPNAAQEIKDPMQKLYVKNILAKNKVITEIMKQIDDIHEHTHETSESETK